MGSVEGCERVVRASYDSVATAYALQVGPIAAADGEMSALFDEVVRRARGGAAVTASDATPSSCPVIADIGCGPGWWTQRMALAGARAVGVDVSAAMVAIAANGDGSAAAFVVGSAAALPLATGAFDGVCLWYVLHHLDDAGVRRALVEARRLCQQGAVVLIGGHIGRGSRIKREGYGHPMEVLVAKRSPQWWEDVVREAGFEVGEHELSDDTAHHVLWSTAR